MALKEDTEEEIGLPGNAAEQDEKAMMFLKNAADNVVQGLMESHENWKLYPQLGYIYE